MAESNERLIKCTVTGCPKQFSAPRMPGHKYTALYMQHGWVHRGSAFGRVYFCDEHASSPQAAKR